MDKTIRMCMPRSQQGRPSCWEHENRLSRCREGSAADPAERMKHALAMCEMVKKGMKKVGSRCGASTPVETTGSQ